MGVKFNFTPAGDLRAQGLAKQAPRATVVT